VIVSGDFEFTIVEANRNRINKVKVAINPSWLDQSYAKILLVIVVLLMVACNEEFTPKPRGYFKIEFPSISIKLSIVRAFLTSLNILCMHKWCRTAHFLRIRLRIHIGSISTSRVQRENLHQLQENRCEQFDKLKEDAYKMTYKHTVKATSIVDSPIYTPLGVSGIYFTVGGNAATGKQFFLSDSTRHFLRGALYFDTTPNEDSLSVVNSFLEKDVLHLINTFQWVNPAAVDQPKKAKK
jgi:gliding motility-associated lipoprotein GldD